MKTSLYLLRRDGIMERGSLPQTQAQYLLEERIELDETYEVQDIFMHITIKKFPFYADTTVPEAMLKCLK